MQAPGWVVTEPRPRVGLLGGTFDPVHNAHIALAHAALSDLVLERVLWLPAGQPWQKVGRVMVPAEHRVAMVRLAIAGEPRFAIDESELTFTEHGVKVADGVMWFDLICGDPACGTAEFRITELNPSS